MAYVSNHRKWFGMGFPKKEILMDYISIFERHFPKITKKGNLMAYVSRSHDQHSECNPENWLHLRYILNVITEHIWDTSGSIFWMESTCSIKSARWSQCWVHWKCNQPVIGLHIVVTLGWSFKMGIICNQQAHLVTVEANIQNVPNF